MTTRISQDFDNFLDSILTEKAGEAPANLEQRLLARLMQAADAAEANQRVMPPLFTSSARMVPQRSAASTWTALGLHAAALLLIAILVAKHVQLAPPLPRAMTALLAPAPPVAPKKTSIGGGGGQPDHAPVTRGHLPRLAQTQIVPPKAPPMMAPRLAVEPSVVVQKDLKMADMKAPDIGAPNSTLRGFSMGNSNGSGIGSGTGSGIGPGTGGNIGGGIYHVGGSVHAPVLTFSIEPEFSEEARKAKFSGSVDVYLIVDEQGNPTHVHVARDVGMGLGDKAVEAVRQYKFKPAMKDGKPVKVDMYVEVDFHIF